MIEKDPEKRRGVSDELVDEFIEILRKPYEPIKPEPQKLPEIRSRKSSPYDASGREKLE